MKFSAVTVFSAVAGVYAFAEPHAFAESNNGTHGVPSGAGWASGTAAVTSATAWSAHSLKTITAESYVTVCPAATTLTWNNHTYTASAGQTLTLTGHATLVVPMTESTWVSCSTCGSGSAWSNQTAAGSTTLAASTMTMAGGAAPTGHVTATTGSSSVATGKADKLFALSGGGLAGVIAGVAFLL